MKHWLFAYFANALGLPSRVVPWYPKFGFTQPRLISFPHGQRQHLLVHQELKRSAGRHRRRPTAGTENGAWKKSKKINSWFLQVYISRCRENLDLGWAVHPQHPKKQSNNPNTEMIKLGSHQVIKRSHPQDCSMNLFTPVSTLFTCTVQYILCTL